MKLVKAMATVAGMTFLSRIAGFARDMLTASLLGAGPVADAFFVALKLPNFFRRITGEGAFSVSFVPLYSEKLSAGGDKVGNDFASLALSVMVAVLLPVSVLMIWAMPFIIMLIAPGFSADPAKFDLAVTMTRISFPYMLLISVTALLGAVLNAHHRFAPFAFAPVLFNLTLIAALLFLTPWVGTAGHAMAIGVTVSGILQVLWMLFWIRRTGGLSVRLTFPRLTPDIRQLFRLMGPGVIGAGVFQINLFADMIIGSLLGTGAISYLYYADRLNQLPLSMIGIAVGTALLPMLSRAISDRDEETARDLYSRSLEYALLLALPSAFGLLLAAEPIVKVLFEHGKFGPEDTRATVLVLMAYAVGLPAYILSKVFSTAYWAHKDTWSPVKIAIRAALLNICLALTLIWPLGVMGIALSTGIVGWLQIAWLYRGIRRRGMALDFDDRLVRAFPKICACTGGLIVTLVMLRYGLNGLFQHESFPVRVGALIALIAGAGGAYGAAVFGIGLLRISDLRRLLRRPQKLALPPSTNGAET